MSSAWFAAYTRISPFLFLEPVVLHQAVTLLKSCQVSVTRQTGHRMGFIAANPFLEDDGATKNRCTCKAMTSRGKRETCSVLLLPLHSSLEILCSDMNQNTCNNQDCLKSWWMVVAREIRYLNVTPFRNDENQQGFGGTDLIAGCAPVWSDSVLKMDGKPNGNRVVSGAKELEGRTTGVDSNKRCLFQEAFVFEPIVFKCTCCFAPCKSGLLTHLGVRQVTATTALRVMI